MHFCYVIFEPGYDNIKLLVDYTVRKGKFNTIVFRPTRPPTQIQNFGDITSDAYDRGFKKLKFDSQFSEDLLKSDQKLLNVYRDMTGRRRFVDENYDIKNTQGYVVVVEESSPQHPPPYVIYRTAMEKYTTMLSKVSLENNKFREVLNAAALYPKRLNRISKEPGSVSDQSKTTFAVCEIAGVLEKITCTDPNIEKTLSLYQLHLSPHVCLVGEDPNDNNIVLPKRTCSEWAHEVASYGTISTTLPEEIRAINPGQLRPSYKLTASNKLVKIISPEESFELYDGISCPCIFSLDKVSGLLIPGEGENHNKYSIVKNTEQYDTITDTEHNTQSDSNNIVDVLYRVVGTDMLVKAKHVSLTGYFGECDDTDMLLLCGLSTDVLLEKVYDLPFVTESSSSSDRLAFEISEPVVQEEQATTKTTETKNDPDPPDVTTVNVVYRDDEYVIASTIIDSVLLFIFLICLICAIFSPEKLTDFTGNWSTTLYITCFVILSVRIIVSILFLS